MPRKGKGQKVQTATGQTYGQAAQQEAAQQMVPLARTPDPPSGQPSAATSSTSSPMTGPGALPFGRPAEPNRVRSAGNELAQIADPVRRARVAAQLPLLEAMASHPAASPSLRITVRRMKAFIGNPQDFADQG